METQTAGLALLRDFNQKVSKLQRGRFARRFQAEEPELVVQFDPGLKVSNQEDGSTLLAGKIKSWLPDLDEEEVDAFVLTYRILTQDNDSLSIRNLKAVYDSGWMPEEARLRFYEARDTFNDYLDSPVTIEFRDYQVSIRQLVEVMIYGEIAHSAKDKATIFAAWTSNPAIFGFVWVEFVAAMRRALHIFEFLKELNEAVIYNLEA